MEEFLELPKFLKLDFSVFDFEFDKKEIEVDKDFFNRLISDYESKENVLLLYNGKVITNNANVDVQTDLSFAKEYLQKLTNQKLEKINKDNLNSFLQINFNKNTQEKNIFIVNAFDGQFAHNSVFCLQENSSVKIFEKVICTESSKINHLTNIEMKRYSHFDYVCFENLTNNNANVFLHNAELDNSAELDLTYLNLNTGKVLNATKSYLNGFEANSKVETITFASKQDIFASLINYEHNDKQTTSFINNVAVVNDFAFVNIDGVNKIENGNSKSSAEQETKIINLKESATSVANPQLIINEFDVKAGHAAAVGKIDAEQLFYLQSRGLTKVQATEILLMAYVDEILQKVKIEEERNTITKIIKQKIN